MASGAAPMNGPTRLALAGLIVLPFVAAASHCSTPGASTYLHLDPGEVQAHTRQRHAGPDLKDAIPTAGNSRAKRASHKRIRFLRYKVRAKPKQRTYGLPTGSRSNASRETYPERVFVPDSPLPAVIWPDPPRAPAEPAPVDRIADAFAAASPPVARPAPELPPEAPMPASAFLALLAIVVAVVLVFAISVARSGPLPPARGRLSGNVVYLDQRKRIA